MSRYRLDAVKALATWASRPTAEAGRRAADVAPVRTAPEAPAWLISRMGSKAETCETAPEKPRMKTRARIRGVKLPRTARETGQEMARRVTSGDPVEVGSGVPVAAPPPPPPPPEAVGVPDMRLGVADAEVCCWGVWLWIWGVVPGAVPDASGEEGAGAETGSVPLVATTTFGTVDGGRVKVEKMGEPTEFVPTEDTTTIGVAGVSVDVDEETVAIIVVKTCEPAEFVPTVDTLVVRTGTKTAVGTEFAVVFCVAASMVDVARPASEKDTSPVTVVTTGRKGSKVIGGSGRDDVGMTGLLGCGMEMFSGITSVGRTGGVEPVTITIVSGRMTVDSGRITVDGGTMTVDSARISVDCGRISVDTGSTSVDSGRTIVESTDGGGGTDDDVDDDTWTGGGSDVEVGGGGELVEGSSVVEETGGVETGCVELDDGSGGKLDELLKPVETGVETTVRKTVGVGVGVLADGLKGSASVKKPQAALSTEYVEPTANPVWLFRTGVYPALPVNRPAEKLEQASRPQKAAL